MNVLIFVADDLCHIRLLSQMNNLCFLVFMACTKNKNYLITKFPQSMVVSKQTTSSRVLSRKRILKGG